MRAAHGTTRTPTARGGFTLIQMLVALGILATLAGLLLAAMSVMKRTVARGATTQLISGISAGVTGFATSFDFAPPLVRDLAKTNPATIEFVKVDSVDVAIIAVYTPSRDADFLRGSTLNVTGTNPLGAGGSADDRRYSLNTLGVYLAGALNQARRADQPDVPIDLVAGPGIGRPSLTGTFDKGTYGPYVDAGGKSLKLSINNDPKMPTVELHDGNDVPIRFYRWLKNKTVKSWDDLNLPAMVVGPDYALFSPKLTPTASMRTDPNPSVTGANWAVVMAGPNRVFGDEPIADVVKALQTYGGMSVDASMSESVLRARAWSDNLVEVGNAPN